MQAEIARAIALNRREYGNKRYDLVRERPEFAPWIGDATGETGRKRFNRLVKVVREPLPKDRTRPFQNRPVNEGQHAWAQEESARANAKCMLPIRLTPEQMMAGGGTALIGFLGLQDIIAEGPADLQRVRAATLVDDPDGVGGKRTIDPDLLRKTVLTSIDFVKGVADLQRDYASIFPTLAFAAGAMRIALQAAGEDPAAQRSVVADFGALIQQFNGLAPGEQA